MSKEDLEKLKLELTRLENKYELAKNELELILRQLYLEYSEENSKCNPIEHINFRLKKISSIQNKLNIKGCNCSVDYIDDYLSDIVGARIVCPFLSDVEKVVHSLKDYPGLRVLICKNYINNPKDNGYSSYHMIVRVPVVINGQYHYVKSEIQIRTMLQDVWASLEHKIRYKKNVKLSSEAQAVIFMLAKEFRELDIKLNDIYLREKLNLKNDDIDSTEWLSSRDESILKNKYQYALNDVVNKIHYLKSEYALSEADMVEVNPIEHIKYRIKSNDRMLSKLKKQTDDLSISSLEERINDIAGVRIVCSFESDLYKIVDDLKNRLGYEIIKEKNYVNSPKESGYAGYHLIVKVPVCQDDVESYAKVEIQVRTIAMDMWASLEDNLCYQKNVSDDIKGELLNLATDRKHIDHIMEEIIKEIRDASFNNQVVKKLNLSK